MGAVSSERHRTCLAATVVTAALLVSLFAPAAARAVPVLETDDHTVYVDGALKSFFFALHFPHFDENVRQLYGLGDSTWGGMAVPDLRLKLEGEHFERVAWQVHYRSQPFLSTFSGAQNSLGFAVAAQPSRILPLQVTAPDDDTFRWNHEIDRLAVQLRLGKVDVIIGRQPVSFGVGFVWLPSDLVGTFSPLELDQEFKPGVDALRVNWALGDFTELTVVGTLGGPRCMKRVVGIGQTDTTFPNGDTCGQHEMRPSSEHSTAMTRLRLNVDEWDIGLLTGWVRGDVVAGAFTVGAIGRFRLRSEAVYTFDIEWDETYAGSGNPNGDSKHFVRAVLGTDYTFDTEKPLTMLAELYYNGFGSFDADDYLTLAQQARVAEHGEVFNLGALYLAAGVNWEPHERLPLALTVLANLHDPSVFFNATVTYKVGDETVIVAGAQLPLGAGPEVDLAGGTIVRAGSEFGLYPFLYYLQWKVYF